MYLSITFCFRRNVHSRSAGRPTITLLKEAGMRKQIDKLTGVIELLSFVETQWLGGRMPDSRSSEPGHDSRTYNGAVDGDTLWRCYAKTK